MKGFWWVSRSIAMHMCPPVWQKHQRVNNSSPSFVARELCGSRRSPGLSLGLGFLLFAGGSGDSRQLSDSLSRTGCFSHPFNEILLYFWGFIRLYFIFCYILLCWGIIYLAEWMHFMFWFCLLLIWFLLFYLHLFLHLFYALFESLLWSFDFASWTFLFLLFNLACIFTLILFHFRLCFDFITFEFDAVFWWWF